MEFELNFSKLLHLLFFRILNFLVLIFLKDSCVRKLFCYLFTKMNIFKIFEGSLNNCIDIIKKQTITFMRVNFSALLEIHSNHNRCGKFHLVFINSHFPRCCSTKALILLFNFASMTIGQFNNTPPTTRAATRSARPLTYSFRELLCASRRCTRIQNQAY